jgi:hypothetical protein
MSHCDSNRPAALDGDPEVLERRDRRPVHEGMLGEKIERQSNRPVAGELFNDVPSVRSYDGGRLDALRGLRLTDLT